MPEEIHNTDLRIDQIPPINSDYTTIAGFALSFDGYSRIKDISIFANKIVEEVKNDKSITEKLTLTELRACLFYEQRRYRHYGEEPEGEDRDYIKGLLLEITKRVEDHRTD